MKKEKVKKKIKKKEKVILKNKVTPDKVWKEANTFSENKQALNHHGYSHKKISINITVQYHALNL